MTQNSFVYLRTAQNQRKTLSFSISIPAVALGTCDYYYYYYYYYHSCYYYYDIMLYVIILLY